MLIPVNNLRDKYVSSYFFHLIRPRVNILSSDGPSSNIGQNVFISGRVSPQQGRGSFDELLGP